MNKKKRSDAKIFFFGNSFQLSLLITRKHRERERDFLVNDERKRKKDEKREHIPTCVYEPCNEQIHMSCQYNCTI